MEGGGDGERGERWREGEMERGGRDVGRGERWREGVEMEGDGGREEGWMEGWREARRREGGGMEAGKMKVEGVVLGLVALVVSSWCGLVVVPSFGVLVVVWSSHIVVVLSSCVVMCCGRCQGHRVVEVCHGRVHRINDDDKRRPQSSFVVWLPRRSQ